jgi:hypothetical protein
MDIAIMMSKFSKGNVFETSGHDANGGSDNE